MQEIRAGFKGFERACTGVLSCRQLEYSVGLTVVHEGPLQIAVSGLHYSLDLEDVFLHYRPSPSTVYGYVQSDGQVAQRGSIVVTDRLTLLHLLEGQIGIYHFKNGQLESTADHAAIEYPDGRCFWYQRNQLHRVDGPAVTIPNGYTAWFYEGKYHRTYGPAVTFEDGRVFWYQHGIRGYDPNLIEPHFRRNWLVPAKVEFHVLGERLS